MRRSVGIDIGSRTHYVAIVDVSQTVVLKPTAIPEDAAGYDKLFALLAYRTIRSSSWRPPATTGGTCSLP
jgi:hypothetical protein